jgi:hypothetical protein
MDLQTAQAILRAKIGNPTTADVPDVTLARLLNSAHREIGSKYPFNEVRCLKAFDTVIDVGRYTLPPDCAAVLKLWDNTNKRKLTKRGMRYLAIQPLNTPTGKPDGYIRARDWIQITPTPDAVYQLMMYYLTIVNDAVAPTDEFLLPVPWHDGIILRARHLYFDERGDIGKAIYAKNEWKDWVADKPSEIDIEKDDLDTGVVVSELGGEYKRAWGRVDPRYDELFDYRD